MAGLVGHGRDVVHQLAPCPVQLFCFILLFFRSFRLQGSSSKYSWHSEVLSKRRKNFPGNRKRRLGQALVTAGLLYVSLAGTSKAGPETTILKRLSSECAGARRLKVSAVPTHSEGSVPGTYHLSPNRLLHS